MTKIYAARLGSFFARTESDHLDSAEREARMFGLTDQWVGTFRDAWIVADQRKRSAGWDGRHSRKAYAKR